MFLGEFAHTIDPKKRLAIPSKFRAELGTRAVLTIGFDTCLSLYPLKEWEKLAEKLNQLPLAKANARSLARFMLSGAMEVELDNLGRVLVPDYLKKYANLKKDAIVTGVFNRIEVWDKTKWAAYKQKASRNINMAKELGELGI
jgi:MraZ protein